MIKNNIIVAVIIPVYKKKLSEDEEKSLLQCIRILSKRTIIFFCATDFDCSFYHYICSKHGIPFIKRTFNSKYFRSKKDYNNLCLSRKFYSAFSDYNFILIYQLDAWVFSDDLDFWCSQGYDYIGAPFPTDLNAKDDVVSFSVVGNGGFSLRRISPMINVFNQKYHRIKKWSQIRQEYQNRSAKNPLWWLYIIGRTFGYKNTVNYLRRRNWEDHFFFEIARLTPFIRIPEPITALKFSFEYRPSVAYIQNGNKLPMGCHGWTWIEYDEFWKQFIK